MAVTTRYRVLIQLEASCELVVSNYAKVRPTIDEVKDHLESKLRDTLVDISPAYDLEEPRVKGVAKFS